MKSSGGGGRFWLPGVTFSRARHAHILVVLKGCDASLKLSVAFDREHAVGNRIGREESGDHPEERTKRGEGGGSTRARQSRWLKDASHLL